MSVTNSWVICLNSIRRAVGISNMQKILRRLRDKGIVLEDLKALEMFGYTGNFHTQDYAPYVAELDVWEIKPALENQLKNNLPMANIKITDTYKEIKHSNKRYDLIVIDNNWNCAGGYYEHFSLFPDVYKIASDKALFIINVTPDLINYNGFSREHIESRQKFYNTDNPWHIPIESMIKTYRESSRLMGFDIDWYFTQKRTSVYYLVFKLKPLQT